MANVVYLVNSGQRRHLVFKHTHAHARSQKLNSALLSQTTQTGTTCEVPEQPRKEESLSPLAGCSSLGGQPQPVRRPRPALPGPAHGGLPPHWSSGQEDHTPRPLPATPAHARPTCAAPGRRPGPGRCRRPPLSSREGSAREAARQKATPEPRSAATAHHVALLPPGPAAHRPPKATSSMARVW